MLRSLILLIVLSLAGAAWAQEPPGESQRRAPDGVTASDGIGGLLAEIYGATPAEGGYPPMRYFSPRLQALIVEDEARPTPRAPRDWLRRPDMAWPSDDFRAYALNTTGAHAGHPASAAAGLWFQDREGWSRRLHLIDQGGYWVIDGVCMFPGGSLERVLTMPGPSEPEHRLGVPPGDC